MGSNSSGQRRLSSTGATNTELLEMLCDTLPSTTKPMTAQEIADTLKSKYGRVLSHRRIAMMMSNNIPWMKKVYSSYTHRTAFKWVFDGDAFIMSNANEYPSEVENRMRPWSSMR